MKLINIPTDNKHNGNVTRLVWGGLLHKIAYTAGEPTAVFKFLRSEDCKAYLAATANGIPWPEATDRVCDYLHDYCVRH